jgi:large subunit ribosomal protein L21
VYAIISDGNHQYRVEEGHFVDVERKELPPDARTMEFDRVLFVGDREGGPRIGQPVVPGAKVIASVLGETKGLKITIHKHRRRKNYKLKKGHRQTYLQLRIDKIEV